MLTRQIINKLYFAQKMSGNILERVIANNKIAAQSLEALKREFSSLKDEYITKKIEEIQKENDDLKKQVEAAKQQLIKLEVANGKKQIPVPNRGQSTDNVETKEVEESPSVAQQTPQQQKKEKPKKEKAAATADKTPPVVEVIDISRLDMRVGKIVEVSRHPDADALYLEKIDCGEANPRTVVSGLVRFIPIEEMKDRMVIVLCNLKPAKMRGVTSEAMVMCASTPEKVEIMSPPNGAVPGDLISCEGYPRNPDAIMNPKKKIFETVAPDLKVNDDFIGTYKGANLIVDGKGPIKAQTLKNVNIK
ncbi:CLUMA_CG002647, isoform A [Clunio marinus]|uniref:CLUMA_CG002647, isoform A n=1 Tax=Clunio marinus TaxID=568069 RepID=A0A1J1HNL1_9DIPT|nr:CLUMA_CG002647, isoform A [Clunio marinus]